MDIKAAWENFVSFAFLHPLHFFYAFLALPCSRDFLYRIIQEAIMKFLLASTTGLTGFVVNPTTSTEGTSGGETWRPSCAVGYKLVEESL